MAKLSTTEAAAIAGVSDSFLRRQIKAEKLAATKSKRGDWEVTEAALRAWMKKPRKRGWPAGKKRNE